MHEPAAHGPIAPEARAGSVRGEGSRASRPGSLSRIALGVALVALAASVAVFLTRPGGRPAPSASAAYGQLPSWLPKARVPVGRTVTATAAHPWLAIQGDTVVVDLAHGRVRAVAVGPRVPEEGRFPVPATSPCSFTVSFSAASGTVPLRPAAFTILDELGHLHRLRVTTPGGGPVPSAVTPGHPVSLTLSGVLPTGNGQLRWAPSGGPAIVSWDFDVEID